MNRAAQIIGVSLMALAVAGIFEQAHAVNYNGVGVYDSLRDAAEVEGVDLNEWDDWADWNGVDH